MKDKKIWAVGVMLLCINLTLIYGFLVDTRLGDAILSAIAGVA